MQKHLVPSLLLITVAVPATLAVPALFSNKPEPTLSLAPYIHMTGAVGTSSNEHPEELTVGHHDPSRENGTLQGLEAGFTFYAPGLRLGGQVTGSLSYGAEEEWEDELEEAFLHTQPFFDELHLRGGRMLSRFGTRNDTHLHSWSTVDTPLPLGAFLGEDGLSLDGGDVSWLSSAINPWGITLGYGNALGHSEEEEEAAHNEEHEDDEEHEDEHGHHHEEAFSGDVFTARLFREHNHSDFYRTLLGASLALGETDERDTRSVLGLDFTFRWRENGLQPGGKAFLWTTETLLLQTDEQSDRLGAYSEVVYSQQTTLDLGLRADWLEEEEAGDRHRLSPFATWYLDGSRQQHLRLQANFDNTPEGNDQTLWLQVNISWLAEEIGL